ncbi:MAG: potassium transporter TrkA [Bacteroidota bacterium]
MPTNSRFRSLKVRWRYWFDNTLNSGTVALIGWLGLFSIVLVIISALVVTVFNVDPAEKDISFIEAFWISLMRTLDPGNLSNDNGWTFRLVMLAVTIVGVLIVSTLIGIVNAGITQTLEAMRKGRSFVDERDHILILGWSPLIFSLLNKLVVSRHRHQRLTIVILADKDKIEMEDELHAKVRYDKKVKIVLRSGNIIDRHDIEIVNPHSARTIVVMAQENDLHDTHSIKTIMALMKSHNRKSEKYHIIVEVRDRENLEVLELLGKDEITPIVSEELFSRMTVQTSLQSGLSEVYNELLDFNDVEVEFANAGTCAGLTYGEALLRFRKGTLIGTHRTGHGSITNPASGTLIQPSDQLIMITSKRNGISPAQSPLINTELFSNSLESRRVPQHTLILGWNNKGPEIIRTLDRQFIKGSQITVFANSDDLEAQVEAVRSSLTNQTLTLERGNIRNRKALTELINKCDCNHVILLCYSDTMDMQSADSLTLITLIHLRRAVEETGRNFTVVSEILDIRNRALAEATHADDFIVSDNIISMVIAQLACNIDLKAVFDELLTPGGADIFLRPVRDYVRIDQPVSFYTIAASAARYNQTAIGYRVAEYSTDAEKKYGVVLSPSKDQLVQFHGEDKVIVISDQ